MSKSSQEMPSLSQVERDLIANSEQNWLKRSSISYLECAISLMLTHMSFPEVVAVLAAQIQLLKDNDGSGIDDEAATGG